MLPRTPAGLVDFKALATTPIPWWGRAVFMLALVVVGFAAGHFSQVAEVVEVHDLKVVWREKATTTAKAATAKTKIVYVDRVVTPDGAIHEKSETREVETAKTDATSVIDRSGEKEEKISKTTTTQPDWRISVQVGASLKAPLLPISGPLVLGVSGERRIIGPFSAGVWLNTVGAGGVVVSGEF